MSAAPDEHLLSQAFWDERYGERDQLWSGRANAQLVERAGALAPGRAADVAAGEGGDAVWLATRGWTVTAVDVSAVALERGAQAARAAGVADRITWVREDARTWRPAAAAYELVTMHFPVVPRGAWPAVLRTLGDGVAAGGTLLVVGHDPVTHKHPGHSQWGDFAFASEDLAPLLDRGTWELRHVGPAARPAGDDKVDTVLEARRRPGVHG